MDRPRSTTRSIPSCSPSSVPTPLSITATQGIRRSHLTPTSATVDGELSLSRLERLSPNQMQRTPTSVTAETGTPRLVAAVSEAKRSGASAPSPSAYANYNTSSDAPMDQFDRLLMKNVKLSNTPSQTPLSAREDTSSPSVVSRAVHNVVVDDHKRRELMLGLQRLLQDVKVIPPLGGTPCTPTPLTGNKAGSRNNTPAGHSHVSAGSHQDATVMSSITTIARLVRDVSPHHHSDGLVRPEVHADPAPFVHQPKKDKDICRPQPTLKPKTSSTKPPTFAEGLAMRDVPTSQKIIKSEMSAFSETTEESNASYNTNKSGKPMKNPRPVAHYM